MEICGRRSGTGTEVRGRKFGGSRSGSEVRSGNEDPEVRSGVGSGGSVQGRVWRFGVRGLVRGQGRVRGPEVRGRCRRFGVGVGGSGLGLEVWGWRFRQGSEVRRRKVEFGGSIWVRRSEVEGSEVRVRMSRGLEIWGRRFGLSLDVRDLSTTNLLPFLNQNIPRDQLPQITFVDLQESSRVT